MQSPDQDFDFPPCPRGRELCAALAMSAIAIQATLAKPLAPPATGWLYTNSGGSFIFPFTATQCEPFYIFHNSTVDEQFHFYDTTYSHILFHINIPKGIGYLEWICNIPAGINFNMKQNFIVQPGSSSACLGNINSTYSNLVYQTANFASYTRTTSSLITPLPTNTLPTTTFPTGAYSTITVNPNLAVTTPTTSRPSSSPPVVTSSISSPPSSTMSSSPLSSPTTLSSPKSHSASVGGGVVGAVAFVLLILVLMLWRRRRGSGLTRTSSPINAHPAATGELGSVYLSPPFQSSGAELPGTTPAPSSHGNELKSDSGVMIVSVAGNLEPVVVPVALSPADIESTTGMPPATLSTQQAYNNSTMTTGGGAIGSGNVNVSNVYHITAYNILHPHPDPSSSLPHPPQILSTTAAQPSG